MVFKNQKSKIKNFFVFLLLLTFACNDDFRKEGPEGNILKNDCIKRSLGPNVAGLDIEFAYAIALPHSEGKILSASVEASIAGDAETWLEHRSYNPDGYVTVGEPSENNGARTMVNFSLLDTCAATLRYYYRIPEAAKGGKVSFTFSASASNGETVTYKMGPYTIAKMDIKHDLRLNESDCFISIEDMAVYTATEAEANPSKIDLIYIYRRFPAWGVIFDHSFVSPAADPRYLPAASTQFQPDGFPLPAGVNKSSRIRKTNELRDRQLYDIPGQQSTSPSGIYVDDIDLETLNFENMPNYTIDVRVEGGMWVETQDGRYRAFIYVNAVTSPNNSGDGTAVISMKRLAMR